MSGDSAKNVRRTRDLVDAAVRTWDPGKPAACNRAAALLNEALETLAPVKVHFERGGTLTKDIVGSLTGLKNDCARLGRLLDASRAFYHGLEHFAPCQIDHSAEAIVRG